MIDGVKVVCPNRCAVSWNDNPLLVFGSLVSTNTGEILNQRKTAEYNGLTFSISPKVSGQSNFCAIAGSLHKYKNGGGINWDSFTFSELQTVLHELQAVYHIDLNQTSIQGMEIGVNIPLDYSPEVIIKSAVSHKGQPFSTLYAAKYMTNKRRIGKYCDYADYTLKLYDKGKQCKNNEHILRVEVKAKRQRLLQPYGISTLADLTDKVKLLRLLELLLSKMNDIIFFDYRFTGSELSEAKQLRYMRYSNPNYWENLTKFSRTKARKLYTELSKKYECIDWGIYCIKKATKIWLDLLELQAENRLLFPRIIEAMQAHKTATFSTLDCLLEKVAQSGTSGNLNKAIKSEQENGQKVPYQSTTEKPRFCVVCGRDISHQKKGSVFCSEKLYGKEARQCRNKDSNRRLAIKRKIKRAMNKDNDLMLRIIYDYEGKEYSDILGVNEISITREWLDKVKRVERLEPQPSTLTGKGAKKYLLTITKTNDYGKN